jgi:exonuclease VII small subunit
MANMSYCRFENTYRDLQDCYEAMANGTEDLSESENKYFERMLKLCKDIVAGFCEPEDDKDDD